MTADAVPDLLSAVGAARALPRPCLTSSFWERVTGEQTQPTMSTSSSCNTCDDPDAPKKILVLGATSGIAEATCRIWAAQGASLFLVARNADKLAAVAADLKTRGASFVDTAVADLDDTAQHPALLAHADQLAGRHGCCVPGARCAGRSGRRRSRTSNYAAQILHTNFVAPVSLLTWLANLLRAAALGVLAVISSVAGDRGRKSNYLYGSSKAGLTAFLGGLRNRVDREGVTVLTIKPGPVKTAMTASMKGSEKFADVDKVGKAIADAVAAKKDTLYVPFQWGPIMWVIRHVPESLFKKQNL